MIKGIIYSSLSVTVLSIGVATFLFCTQKDEPVSSVVKSSRYIDTVVVAEPDPEEKETVEIENVEPPVTNDISQNYIASQPKYDCDAVYRKILEMWRLTNNAPELQRYAERVGGVGRGANTPRIRLDLQKEIFRMKKEEYIPFCGEFPTMSLTE